MSGDGYGYWRYYVPMISLVQESRRTMLISSPSTAGFGRNASMSAGSSARKMPKTKLITRKVD